MATSLFAENQAAVPCSRCQRPVRLADSRNDLKVVSKLYRLRCPHLDCGSVDWYMEYEFIVHHGPAIDHELLPRGQ